MTGAPVPSVPIRLRAGQRRNPLAAALLAASAVVLASWSAADAWVGATRDRMPDAALSIYPNDPLAQARQASNATDRAKASFPPAAVEKEALASLRQLALNPRALRVAAMARAGRQDDLGALQFLRLGERVTRRDLLTQMMLIETAVARGDVAGALTHYDRALRVSPDAGSVLFPTLAAASGDPGTARQIRTLVAGNPPWLPQFVDWITHYATALGPLLPILQQMAPTGPALDREHQRLLVDRLVKEADYVAAFQLYRHLQGAPPPAKGRLPFGTQLPPLDWDLETEGDRSAATNRDTGNLTYYVEGSAYGQIARRLLALPPGRYDLVTAGTSDLDEPARWPVWSIRCATGDAPLVRAVPAVRAQSTQPMATFVVPRGCAAQWLSLATPSPADRSQSGEIAPVLIRSIG